MNSVINITRAKHRNHVWKMRVLLPDTNFHAFTCPFWLRAWHPPRHVTRRHIPVFSAPNRAPPPLPFTKSERPSSDWKPLWAALLPHCLCDDVRRREVAGFVTPVCTVCRFVITRSGARAVEGAENRLHRPLRGTVVSIDMYTGWFDLNNSSTFCPQIVVVFVVWSVQVAIASAKRALAVRNCILKYY